MCTASKRERGGGGYLFQCFDVSPENRGVPYPLHVSSKYTIVLHMYEYVIYAVHCSKISTYCRLAHDRFHSVCHSLLAMSLDEKFTDLQQTVICCKVQSGVTIKQFEYTLQSIGIGT